ncbi:MAG: hypothetical protein ACI4IQ_00800 [Eubacterium sp.]
MKKFLIIFTAICILFAFTACSSKEYVDVVVTAPVTDKNGEAVTDAEGKAVTEIVTDESGWQVTTTVDKSVTKDSDITASGTSPVSIDDANAENSAASSSVQNKTTVKENETTEKTTEKATDTKTTQNNTTENKTSTTQKQTTNKATTKAQTTTEKETTTQTTTKSKRREIKVNVKLPFYNNIESEITVSYRVVGDKNYKELDSETVVLDGTTVKTYSLGKLKGDVEVIVKLSGVDITGNTITVPASDEDQEVEITPATGIEVMNGVDD